MPVQVIKPVQTIAEYGASVVGTRHGLFQSLKTRNAVAKWLETNWGYDPKKSSSRGSRLHPEYVTDFIGEYETGFGNTDYDTHWKVLYSIEIE